MTEPAERQILAVDDDAAIGRLLQLMLSPEGFRVTVTENGAAFLQTFERIAPDLCILDYHLPDTDGLTLLSNLRKKSPDVPAIILTGDEKIAALAAEKAGLFIYLGKPVDRSQLLLSIANAMELHRRRSQPFDRIIGPSTQMREAKATARKLAASDATVLIRGENGTGKELFARALHDGGRRVRGEFVDVNCAALTETLLESEIFGHEKGAFTGAATRHTGKFEQAGGGTIFLDEIGDMPLGTQAKLLRVLQERSFQRVGGTERVTVDVRVISATNQPLEQAVAEGRFRQDLYYRINTVTLEIPPLRGRREDVPELARHFVVEAARQEGRPVPEIPPETLRLLQQHAWPGNVRELENAMRRAVVLCDGPHIEPAHLPSQVCGITPAGAPAPTSGNMLEAVEALERRMITDALEKNGWVKARAARALGVTERILSYKMDSYGIVRQAT